MPQNALAATVAVNPSGQQSPCLVDAQKTQMITPGGLSTSLNITAATVVKAKPGRICKVSVIVAGSGTGTVNDLATTSGASAANQLYVVPQTQGIYELNLPCVNGILVVPGTGQTLAVSYI